MKDITEKIEVELKNNKTLWQTTLDAIKESIFLIDLDHKILKCNRATLNLLGKSSYNEIISHSCWELVHDTSEPFEWCPVKRMLESGHREATIRQLNGRWVEISADPVFNDEGEISGAVHVITDITTQKQAEEALRESEEQYLTIFNSLSDAIHVLDRDLRIIFQNPAMVQWLEKLDLNSDNIGKNIFEAFPFLDYDKVYHEYDKVFKDGDLLITTDTTKLFDRNLFTETLKIPIIIKGEVKQIITILRNITDHKEAEEKYKNIINNLMDTILIIDLNGNFLYASPQIYNLSGFTPEEIISKNGLALIHPDDRNSAIEILKKALEQKERVYIEYRALNKAGEYKYVSGSGRIINIEGENRIIATIKDISEKKISEQKLKESEEKFRNLFENSPNILILLDQKGVILDVNHLFLNKFNYKKKELIGKNFRDINRFNSNNTLIFIEKYNEIIKNGKIDPFEIETRNKEGFSIWLNLQASATKIGTQQFIQVILQDITDKKLAENNLKESEEKYRYLIENALEGVWVVDSNAVTILVNPSMAKILGYKVEEMVGKSLFAFMDEEAAKITINHLEKRKKGISEERDAVFINRNGDKVYLRIKATPIFDNDGGYEGTFAFLEDITQRRLTEQKLKESEEMFRKITEQAFMGILIIRDEKIEYVNNALLQVFEYSPEEIYYWSKDDLVKLIHPEDLQFLREYRQKLRTGNPNIKPYYSYRTFTKSGKLKWIDQFSKPIIYKGKPAELVTIMDITEKKEAEQELIKLNSLKSELLRRTSHELKTPLVSIKGYSDLLLNVHKEKLDDYVLASIVEIKQGCERLESLIQDILNTAELESGTTQLKKREEDLSFLIKLSLRELQGLANLRNHTIKLKIHDKLITYFEPEQIHQVISNLLNNAIKYTPPGGTIEIKSEVKDKFIIISVKDSGIGITREEKERIFTQFGKIERYGQGLDIISDGSGLGLFITKKIVELHDGKIWVESEGRNKGSTFHFRLPFIIENSEETIP